MRSTAFGNGAIRNAAALAVAALAAAGCASESGYHPTEIAQESHIYAGGGLGSSKFDEDKGAIDASLAAQLNSFGIAPLDNTSTLDDSDLAFTAALGYRIGPFFGVEAAYYRLGKEKYRGTITADDGTGPAPFQTNLDIRTTGLGVSALAFLPIKQNYEVYVRGGLLLANTDFNVSQSYQGQTQGGSSSSDSSDFFVGGGFSYYYQDSLEFRLEYQKFLNVGNSDSGEVDIDTIGLQIMYSIF